MPQLLLHVPKRSISVQKQGMSIDVVRQFSRHRNLNTLMVYRDLHDNKQGMLAALVSAQIGR